LGRQISQPGRFPRVRSRDERYLGDIYISPAFVQRQCKDPALEEVITLEQRLPVLLAHGLCHLMGCVSLRESLWSRSTGAHRVDWRRSYDHETDPEYERMQQAENFILSRYQQFLPIDSADSKP
jgi:ssRNA-specific RNase YbeY (16S rRNA maturation enzyme)